jgi:hypothetical protein
VFLCLIYALSIRCRLIAIRFVRLAVRLPVAVLPALPSLGTILAACLILLPLTCLIYVLPILFPVIASWFARLMLTLPLARILAFPSSGTVSAASLMFMSLQVPLPFFLLQAPSLTLHHCRRPPMFSLTSSLQPVFCFLFWPGSRPGVDDV